MRSGSIHITTLTASCPTRISCLKQLKLLGGNKQ